MNNIEYGKKVTTKNPRYDLGMNEMLAIKNMAIQKTDATDIVFTAIMNAFYNGVAKGYKLAKKEMKEAAKNNSN